MTLKPELSNELRGLVREILKEVVPQKASTLAAVETVSIGSDTDLNAFVKHVIEKQEAIRQGRLRFTLGGGPAQTKTGAVSDVLTGVISEHVVERHAQAGTLLLGPDAVITPLGRDRARKLGLKIERRR